MSRASPLARFTNANRHCSLCQLEGGCATTVALLANGMRLKKTVSLGIEAQKAVLVELAPLADQSWVLVNALQTAGWKVMLPRLKFEESFGQGEEIVEYRRFVEEVAKVLLASPNCRFRLPEYGPYISPYLEELRQRRDQENAVRFGATPPPRWAEEVATCLRRMEFLRCADRAEFDRQLRGIRSEEQELRVAEIASHASGFSKNFYGELERPIRFYSAVMSRETESIGFTLDTRRSTDTHIVFSKPLMDGWDLCLTPDPLAWFPGTKNGEARVLMSVQATRHTRSIKKAKWDQVMMIEYRELIRHFDLRYFAFESLDELEIVIMARICLLSLTLEEIESRLRAGFSKLRLERGA